jgi:hypothetical protein
MKKGTILTLFMTILLCSGLTGCGHTHEWKDATCTEPKTCTECGKTEGSPLGHTWTVATCTAPKTCTVCGETEGTALAHTWVEATCTTPKTCTVCGETEGTALGHTWQDATCTTPKTCTVCGETEGELAEHDLNSTGKCNICGKQVGYALNMSNYKQYLNVTFSFTTGTTASGKANPQVDVNAEPVKNVTFSNVIIHFTYQNCGDFDYRFNVDSTGYGHIGYHANGKAVGYAKVTSIEGYIIE